MATTLTERLAATAFHGDIVAPGDAAYDEARKVYNGMIDRRPALLARCTDAGDVAAAIDVGRRRDMKIAVRGGGHNAGGLGVADDALVIDLEPMKAIEVDAARGTVRVGGGCRWSEVDEATTPHGLNVPCGIVAHTGVAGLTLGGGMGYLARRHGLTIDNLLAADVVLADGRTVRASEDEHPDLFWALRGGGGNFGVVTDFHFRAAPVGEIVGGPMMWSLDDAPDVMRFWDTLLAGAPDELYGWFGYLTVPPDDSFPKELQLQKVAGIVWCWTGDPADADDALASIRAFRTPVLDGVQPMPLAALNSAFDPLFPPGLQWYWKAHFVDELPDAAIDAHLACAREMPTWRSTMHLYPIDGAAGRVAPDATAFGNRGARWAQVIVGIDDDPASAPRLREWARNYYDLTAPYARAGAYVNFMMDDEGDERVRATYAGNYDRLVDVKREYDPDNVFRVNQNIAP